MSNNNRYPYQPKLLTTAQTCTILGVHGTTLWRWRQSGTLIPARRDRNGHFQYERAAVERFQRQRSRRSSSKGVAAADVYDMFEQGHSDSDIVIALRVTPAQVAALREQHASPGWLQIRPRLRKSFNEVLARYGLRAETAEELFHIMSRTLETNELLNQQLLIAQDKDG